MLSVNGHLNRNPITSNRCLYGVCVTECDEWIRSCGVVLGEDSK